MSLMTDDERNSLKNRAEPPLRVVPIPAGGRIQVEALRNYVNDLSAADYVRVEVAEAPPALIGDDLGAAEMANYDPADAPKRKPGRPKKAA